jgi:hypothetical protein
MAKCNGNCDPNAYDYDLNCALHGDTVKLPRGYVNMRRLNVGSVEETQGKTYFKRI